MSIQPSQAVCPNNQHGATHHLIPRRAGSQDTSELTCIFCRQSEASIRAELAEQAQVTPPPSNHVQTLTISPDMEVIGSCQDCSWHKYGSDQPAHEEIRTLARQHAVERGHAAAVSKTNRTTTTFRTLPREGL